MTKNLDEGITGVGITLIKVDDEAYASALHVRAVEAADRGDHYRSVVRVQCGEECHSIWSSWTVRDVMRALAEGWGE